VVQVVGCSLLVYHAALWVPRGLVTQTRHPLTTLLVLLLQRSAGGSSPEAGEGKEASATCGPLGGKTEAA
jgi:hypothetical protein